MCRLSLCWLAIVGVAAVQIALSPLARATNSELIPPSLQIQLADALIEKRKLSAMEARGEDTTEMRALVQTKSEAVGEAISIILNNEKLVPKHLPWRARLVDHLGVAAGVVTLFGVLGATLVTGHYMEWNQVVLTGLMTVLFPATTVSVAVVSTRVSQRIQAPYFRALVARELEPFFERLKDRGLMLTPEGIDEFVGNASELKLEEACGAFLAGSVGVHRWLDSMTQPLLGSGAIGPGRWLDEP